MSATGMLLSAATQVLEMVARPLSVRKIIDVGVRENLFDGAAPPVDALRGALEDAAGDDGPLKQLRRGVFALNEAFAKPRQAPATPRVEAEDTGGDDETTGDIEEEGTSRRRRRRRSRKTEELENDPPAPLTVEDAVADAEGGSGRDRLWQKMRARAAALASAQTESAEQVAATAQLKAAPAGATAEPKSKPLRSRARTPDEAAGPAKPTPKTEVAVEQSLRQSTRALLQRRKASRPQPEAAAAAEGVGAPDGESVAAVLPDSDAPKTGPTTLPTDPKARLRARLAARMAGGARRKEDPQVADEAVGQERPTPKSAAAPPPEIPPAKDTPAPAAKRAEPVDESPRAAPVAPKAGPSVSERAAVTPKERAPVTPKERAPVTPKERTSATPKERTPVAPRERAPVAPKERPPVPSRKPDAPAPRRLVPREIEATDVLVAAALAALRRADEPLPLEAIASAVSTSQGAGRAVGLRAALLADNSQRAKSGRREQFGRRRNGDWALTEWALSKRYLELEKSIEAAMGEQREIARRDLLAKVAELGDTGFEQLVVILLEQLGYRRVRVVHREAGGNVALTGALDSGGGPVMTAVVARRAWTPIGSETLRALRSSLHHFGAARGLVLTVGTFEAGAREQAVRLDLPAVDLVDGAGLARLLFDRGVGLARLRPLVQHVAPVFFDAFE